MSYDLRLAVRVHGADHLYAVIDEPEVRNPTYNLSEMFRACTGWDFEQSKYYNAAEVLPKIQHGINELTINRKEYIKYNDPNGWGTVDGALSALKSLEECIKENVSGDWTWNRIPLECLYVAW